MLFLFVTVSDCNWVMQSNFGNYFLEVSISSRFKPYFENKKFFPLKGTCLQRSGKISMMSLFSDTFFVYHLRLSTEKSSTSPCSVNNVCLTGEEILQIVRREEHDLCTLRDALKLNCRATYVIHFCTGKLFKLSLHCCFQTQISCQNVRLHRMKRQVQN